MVKRLVGMGLALMLTARVSCAWKPLSFGSPNGRWAVEATPISVNYRYDVSIRDLKLGQRYLGLGKRKPASNEYGPWTVYAIWTADSRFAAVGTTIGHSIAECEVIEVGKAKPKELARPWETPENPLELGLLKEADKKRFIGWRHLRVGPDKWLNNTDLTMLAEMEGDLKAADGEPSQAISVSAEFTVRYAPDASGKILSEKWTEYEVTPNTP